MGKECKSDGVNFSGGERQKIAIARAIYKNAPFVIMDEPTAALDPEAEAEVFEGFDKCSCTVEKHKTWIASPATIPKSGERNRKIHSCMLYLISI